MRKREPPIAVAMRWLKWILMGCLVAIALSNVLYFTENFKQETATLSKLNHAVVEKAVVVEKAAQTMLRKHGPALIRRKPHGDGDVAPAGDGGTKKAGGRGDVSSVVGAWQGTVSRLAEREAAAAPKPSNLPPNGTAPGGGGNATGPDPEAFFMCMDADPWLCSEM